MNKEQTLEIGQALKERLNNQFFNSLLISLVVMNYKGIVVFLFSDSSSRKDIIANHDLTAELPYAILYAVVFLIFINYAWPIADEFIKGYSYRFVRRRALENESKRQELVEELKYACSEEAARLKFERKLDSWDTRKQELEFELEKKSNEVETLSETCNSYLQDIKFKEKNIGYYESANRRMHSFMIELYGNLKDADSGTDAAKRAIDLIDKELPRKAVIFDGENYPISHPEIEQSTIPMYEK